MNEAETPLTPNEKHWLWNIWHSQRLESELGICPSCSSANIEFQVWRLGDGTIRKYQNCPDCRALIEAARRSEEETARLVKVSHVRRYMRETCGIPPKFMVEDFSTFKAGWQDKALEVCQSYADDFPLGNAPRGYPSLYLWSTESWGCGKTHLAAAICHRVFDRWTGKKGCPRIVFLSEPELFRRIQATYSFSREESNVRESEDDIIKSIVGADLLVLDDVGKEPRKDMQFVRRTLFAIINARYNALLPMVVTANLDPGRLKEHLDEPPTEASFNRLWEMTDGRSIRMDGRSYRKGGKVK